MFANTPGECIILGRQITSIFGWCEPRIRLLAESKNGDQMNGRVELSFETRAGSILALPRLAHLLILLFVATCSADCLSAKQPAEPPEPYREWTSAVGSKVVAKLVDQDAKTVTLLFKDAKSPRKLELAQLDPKEHQYLQQRLFEKRLWYDQQDLQQFQIIKDHLRSVNERPETVSRLLIEIHNEFPASPYAGLWAAVTLSAGTNEHQRATVLLEQTIKRIQKQQKIDSNRHRMTFCSASSNLAICLIKARKGDSAATRMIQAIDSVDRLPPVIRSNSELLNELTVDSGGWITFSPSTRARLMRSIALAKSPGSGTKLPDRWHYTLDFDSPAESPHSLKVDGIDAPFPGLQLLASGSGFAVAPGIILTTRPVIETTNYRGPKLVTVITEPSTSSRKSELVRDLLVTSTQSYATSAQVGSGEFFPTKTWTNYRYVRSQDGQMGAEIAALRVPNLALPAVEVARDDPEINTEIRIVGLSRGQSGLERGLQFEAGKVLRTKTIRGTTTVAGTRGRAVSLETSARVLGGNRGGPVIDRENRVVGIAYDTPVSGGDAKGSIFGSGEFSRWFFDNVQTASLVPTDPKTNPTDRLANVSDSVVAVYCWGLQPKSSSQLFSELTDNSRDSSGIYLEDHWCMACNGKGVVDCHVRGCSKGFVSGRRTVDGPRSPITGKPTKIQTVTRVRCNACNGKGGKKCPHCDGGKI